MIFIYIMSILGVDIWLFLHIVYLLWLLGHSSVKFNFFIFVRSSQSVATHFHTFRPAIFELESSAPRSQTIERKCFNPLQDSSQEVKSLITTATLHGRKLRATINKLQLQLRRHHQRRRAKFGGLI